MHRIYIYDDMAHFTGGDLAKACSMLSPARLRTTMHYVNDGDRKQSAIAELLLRHALRDAFAIGRLPEMCRGAHGKPRFCAEGMPEFNLTHCPLAVACIVADEAAGIDAEPYSSYGDDVAREVFNAGELQCAAASPAAFAELWTRKESYLKFTGEGLRDDLKPLLGETGAAVFRTFHSSRGYACTVCTRTPVQLPPTFVDKTTLFNG